MKKKIHVLIAIVMACACSQITDQYPDSIGLLQKITYTRHSIVYDNGNHNGIADRGETVYVQVFFKNTSTNSSNGVNIHAAFTTSSAHASILADNDSYYYPSYPYYNGYDGYYTYTIYPGETDYIHSGSIQKGNGDYVSYSFAIKIAQTAPAGSKISVDISMTAGIDYYGSNYYTDMPLIAAKTIEIEVGSAEPVNIPEGISVSDWHIVKDDNNDGIANKGETIYLLVNLKNNTANYAYSVSAVFSSTSPYIAMLSPSTEVSYGSMAAGTNKDGEYACHTTTGYSSCAGYYTLKFSISSTAANNTQIPVVIKITDGAGNAWTQTFNVNVVVKPYDVRMAFDTYLITSSTDGDSTAQSGESITMRVGLKNIGTSSANSITASITTASSYITWSSSYPHTNMQYGAVAAGSTAWANISFNISASAPVYTNIPFAVSMSDDRGNTWQDNFTMRIVPTRPMQINVSRYQVIIDTDGDSKVEPGETVYLQVFLRNDGATAASGVNAVFSTASGYISLFEPSTAVSYGTIERGTSVYGRYAQDFGQYYTIKFSVSSSVAVGTQLPIAVSITAGAGSAWQRTFNVVVQ